MIFTPFQNKKAMMDDLFDLLFTVMVAFFALLFIHAALVKSIDDRDKKSLVEMNSVMEIGVNILNQQNILEKGENPSMQFDKIGEYKLTLPIKAIKSGGVVEVVKEPSSSRSIVQSSETIKEPTPSGIKKGTT